MPDFLPPVVAELRANITDFSAKMGEARAVMHETEGYGSSKFQGLASVGKAATLALGASAIAVGAFSVKAAMDAEMPMAALRQSIENTGKSWSALKGPVDDMQSHMRSLGFSNIETANSLARITQVTHDPTKALSDMGLAADLARARHIDLGTATDILAKVETGHVALLGRMGIATKDAAGHTYTADQMMQQLRNTIGGSATAASKTFEGRMQALKQETMNLAEKLGEALIPVIESVISHVSQIIEWFEKHRVAAIALAAIVGGVLVAAITAWAVSLFMAGGALAFLMSPVTLIVAAIAALAAGVIYAYNHWSFFHDAVDAVAKFITGTLWPAIKNVAEAVSNGLGVAVRIAQAAFRDFHPEIELAGRILSAVFKPALEVIKTGLELMGETMKWVIDGPLTWLANGFKVGIRTVVDVFLEMVGTIVHGAASAFGWIPGLGPNLKTAANDFDTFSHDVRNALDGVITKVGETKGEIDAFNKSADAVANHVRDLGGGQFKIGSGGMQARAAGGPVDPNQGYWVGESGPEFFQPTTAGNIGSASAATGNQGGGTTVVNQVTVNAPNYVGSAQELIDAVHAGLLNKGRSVGSLFGQYA